jgi:hypothetical protein
MAVADTEVPLPVQKCTHMKRKTAYSVDTCYLFVVALELPREPVVDADHFTFEAQFCKHPVSASTTDNAVPGRVEWQEQALHSVVFVERPQNSEHGPPVSFFRGSPNDSCMLGIQNTDLGKV